MIDRLYCDTCERYVSKKDIRLLVMKSKCVHSGHKLRWKKEASSEEVSGKVVKGCAKCLLTFPQYPDLEHCPQCGRPLVPMGKLDKALAGGSTPK